MEGPLDTPSRIQAALEIARNGFASSINLYREHVDKRTLALLATALETNTTVTAVNLASSATGDDGAKALCRALQRNGTVKTLDLGSNAIGDSGIAALASAMRSHPTLTSLDLGGNTFGSAGIKKLASVLSSPSSHLSSLDLCGIALGAEGAAHLAHALAGGGSLRSLSLGRCNLREHGAKYMHDILVASHPALQTLDLCMNDLGDHGASHIAKGLACNQSLTSLNLCWNEIGPVGAEALAATLVQNAKLIILDLGSNRLGSAGSKSLIVALTRNTTLESLNLSWNGIERTGLIELAEGLRNNTTIKTLEISGNSSEASTLTEVQAVLGKRQKERVSLETKPPPPTHPSTPVRMAMGHRTSTKTAGHVSPRRHAIALARKKRIQTERENVPVTPNQNQIPSKKKAGNSPSVPPPSLKESPLSSKTAGRSRPSVTMDVLSSPFGKAMNSLLGQPPSHSTSSHQSRSSPVPPLCLDTLDKQLIQDENDKEMKAWETETAKNKADGRWEMGGEQVALLEQKENNKTHQDVPSPPEASLDRDPGRTPTRHAVFTIRRRIKEAIALDIQSFFSRDVISWTVEEVQQWMSIAGLGEYGAAFSEHAISGEALIELTSDDLLKIFHMKMGHLRIFLKARDDLRRGTDFPTGGTTRAATTDSPSCQLLMDRYAPGDILYQGPESRVYAGEDTRTERKVAIKLTNNTTAHERELKMLKLHQSDYVVDLVDSYSDTKDDNRHILVFEMGYLTLRQILDRTVLSEADMRASLVRLLDCLHFLHVRRQCHCDVKPENFMLFLNPNPIFKLIDFDNSISCGDPIPRTFTPAYCAPEVARWLMDRTQPQPVAHESIDIWAFGMVALEVYLGYNLFSNYDNEEDILLQLVSEDELVLPRDMSDSANSFFRRCLCKNPRNRSSLGELRCHAFLAGGKTPTQKERDLRAHPSMELITHRLETMDRRIKDSVAMDENMYRMLTETNRDVKESRKNVEDVLTHVQSSSFLMAVDILEWNKQKHRFESVAVKDAKNYATGPQHEATFRLRLGTQKRFIITICQDNNLDFSVTGIESVQIHSIRGSNDTPQRPSRLHHGSPNRLGSILSPRNSATRRSIALRQQAVCRGKLPFSPRPPDTPRVDKMNLSIRETKKSAQANAWQIEVDWDYWDHGGSHLQKVTPRGQRVFITLSLWIGLSKVNRPVRFSKELALKIYHPNAAFRTSKINNAIREKWDKLPMWAKISLEVSANAAILFFIQPLLPSADARLRIAQW